MGFSEKFYDQGWPVWDDMKLYGPTARHTRRLIFKLLKTLSFNSVLDAGCGTGVLLKKIHEKYPYVELTGSEYSPQGLDFAAERLPDATFNTLNLETAKFDRQFDLVTCIDVLEHIENDRAALNNLLAMTSKYLVLSVPLGPLFKEEVDRMGHVHGYSRAEVDEKICTAGFEIMKAIQWGFPFYNIHRRFANRMTKQATTGQYSYFKKLVSSVLFVIFYLNIASGGERYYVLCRPLVNTKR